MLGPVRESFVDVEGPDAHGFCRCPYGPANVSLRVVAGAIVSATPPGLRPVSTRPEL